MNNRYTGNTEGCQCEVKPNLSLKVDITSESGVSMKELDFALRFFVYGNPEDVNIHKSQLYQHEGKYYALLNEESFAKGWLFCDVIIAEYASGNPNVSYVTVRCNTGCLVNDCCREAEDLTTSGQGYVVKFFKEEVYPYPGYTPEYLTSEELWTSYFRLPELTADRAIADEHGNRITDTYVRREAVANHIKQIYNQQFLDNPPLITEGYITPEMLSEETKQMLEATGQEITNLPDGEDLQSVHGVLKLADKQYNPNSYSGLGRRILRKNIVAGVNVLTQSMMQWPNTIYVIQYDYDLQGETITVPEGCVFQFEGGKLGNGVIVGNNTAIKAGLVKIFELDTELSSEWNVSIAHPEWFGAIKGNKNVDNSVYINKALDVFNHVSLSKGVYYIDYPIIMTSYNKLHGHGGDSTKGTSIIKNTNNAATNIPITNYNLDLNVDAVIIVIPNANDPAGANQYNEVSIKNVFIQSKNGKYGIIASDGRRIEIENVLCRFSQYSYVVEYSFFVNLVNCMAQPSYGAENNGFEDSVGFRVNTMDNVARWTTINLTRCYANSCHKGYMIHNSSYSTMSNCSCDAAIKTAYEFNNCHGLSIHGNGCESCKLEDRNKPYIYHFNSTEASLISCDSSSHKQHSNDSYVVAAINNSYISIINLVERTSHGLKYKADGYSSIVMGGYRTFDSSLLEGSENSSIVVFTSNGVDQINNSKNNINFASIISSSNYLKKIPTATKDTAGLMPGGCLPSNSLPSGITDANQLKNGTFYVGANFPNTPIAEHGCITTFSTDIVGFQLYSSLSTYNLYVRYNMNGWGKWYKIKENDAKNKESGNTEERPNLGSSYKGYQYFDTTLNKPIWWTGSKWVDATGAEV